MSPDRTEELLAANRALRIGPEDRVLWLLPMAHHFVVSILLYLRYGAAILLPASPLARPVLELANRGAATVVCFKCSAARVAPDSAHGRLVQIAILWRPTGFRLYML